MNIADYLQEFLKESTRRTDPHYTYARSLLFSEKEYSLCKQEKCEDSDCLAVNIRQSVQKYTRDKDSAIGLYKELVKFLRDRGVDVAVEFPPIPIGSSFERQMFIAKYLQSESARIADLPDLLWVGERTIREDIQRLRGESGDPIQICGRKFVIDDTARERGQLRFSSTAHPLFLTENLTQVIILLKGLKSMAENSAYQRYAEATAAEIWEQLSDYAKQRVRYVLENMLPDDLTWYAKLEPKDANSFLTERQCSVEGNVWMDCLKNGKTFCMEYRSDAGTEFLKDCSIIPRSFREDSFEIMCDQGQKRIETKRVVRSCYTIEELLSD